MTSFSPIGRCCSREEHNVLKNMTFSTVVQKHGHKHQGRGQKLELDVFLWWADIPRHVPHWMGQNQRYLPEVGFERMSVAVNTNLTKACLLSCFRTVDAMLNQVN